MFEKANPAHVDKIADRIAGAIVDLAYGMEYATLSRKQVYISRCAMWKQP